MKSVAFAFAFILVLCLLDFAIDFGFWTRLLFALLVYASVAAITWYTWLRDYLKPLSPERAAWLVEKSCPQLKEKLISSVELSQERPGGISMEFVEHVLEEAREEVANIKSRHAFPFAYRLLLIPLVVSTVIWLGVSIPDLRLGTHVKRVLAPSPVDASSGILVIKFTTPTAETFNEGDRISFKLGTNKPVQYPVELYLQGSRLERIEMAYDREKQEYHATVPDVRDSFLFWAQCGEVRSKAHSVTINKRPHIREFDIKYTFPAYVHSEPVKVTSTSGDLRALAGTEAFLQIHCSKALKKMVVRLDGQDLPVALSKDFKTGMVFFNIAKNGAYEVEILDQNGLSSYRRLSYNVTVLKDQPPKVAIVKPEDNENMDIDGVVQVKWEWSDDFGVTEQKVTCKVNGVEKGEKVVEDLKTFEQQIVLDEYGLRSGDELEVYVSVRDFVGNKSRSKSRFVLIGGGRRLRFGEIYLRELCSLEALLDGAATQLAAIREFNRTLQSQKTDFLNDRQHQRRMNESRQDILAAQLRDAQLSVQVLRDYGFFKRNDYYTELLKRYIRQERLFHLPHLADPENRVQDRLEEMVALSEKMRSRLRTKAQQYLSTISLPLHARRIDYAKNLDLKVGLDRLERIRKAVLAESIRLEAEETTSLLELDFKSSKNGERDLREDLEVTKLAVAVNKLESLAQALASRHDDLEKAADEIRRKLISPEDNWRHLADQLDAHKRQQDWRKVERLVEEFRREARTAASPALAMDKWLVADALETAARKENSEILRKIGELSQKLERTQALEEYARDMEKLRNSESRALEKVRTASGETRSRELNADRLKTALTRIDDQWEKAETLKRLDGIHDLDSVQRALDHVREEVRAAENGNDGWIQEQVAKSASNAQARLNEAMRKMADIMEQQNAQTEKTRHDLEHLAAPDSEKIKNVAKSIRKAAGELEKMAKTPDSKALDHLEDRVADARKKLQEVTEELRRETARELDKLKDQDLRGSREKMALSNILEKVDQNELKGSQNALEKAKSAGLRAATDPKNSQQWDNEVKHAQQKLDDAARKLADAARMLGLHEAKQDGQLSMTDAKKAQAQLEKRVARQKGEKDLIQKRLGELADLEAKQKKADELAEKSRQLEDHPNDAQGDSLRKEVDNLKKGLDNLAQGRESPPEAQSGDSKAKQPDLARLSKVADDISKALNDGAQSKTEADKLKKKLREATALARKSLDQIDPEELGGRDRRELEDTLNRLSSMPPYEQSNRVNDAARMAEYDPKLHKELEKAAKNLGQQNDTDHQTRQAQNKAAESARDASRLASDALRELDPKSQLQQASKRSLDALKDNAESQDFASAKKNLDAFKKNLVQMAKEQKGSAPKDGQQPFQPGQKSETSAKPGDQAAPKGKQGQASKASQSPGAKAAQKAAGQVGKAGQELANNKANRQSTGQLGEAADTLRQAAQDVKQDLMERLAQMTGNNMASTSGEGVSDGPRQTGKGVADSSGFEGAPNGQLKDGWAGTEKDLSGSDRKGRARSYSPYYRKANKEYLQIINKESRTWHNE